jgi:hypothetical protein
MQYICIKGQTGCTIYTIHTAEPGIEPGTSWLVVRSSDHEVRRLVMQLNIYIS